MKSWFLVRGYPKYLIEAEMKKVTLTSEYRNTKRGRLLKVVPFVMADHPISTSIKKVILKYLDLLYIDKEVKRVFILKPMISFRSARKVSSYLVRAKLYPPKELKNPISVVENALRSAWLLTLSAPGYFCLIIPRGGTYDRKILLTRNLAHSYFVMLQKKR